MKEIRPSKTVTHGIKPYPTTERHTVPPSQNISNEYDELDAVTGKKWERV